MLRRILNCIHDVSLSKETGRFLADKSYGFDTIFFVSKFIKHNAVNNRFNKTNLRQLAIAYTEDIFQLTPGTAGAVNYFVETINLLEYANIVKKINNSRDDYLVVEPDILDYIAESPENAYIALYAIVWQTFKNDNLLSIYENYCDATSLEDKGRIALTLFGAFVDKSISIGDSSANWAKQLVKYALTILGYANEQNKIARTLNVHEELIDVRDIALNIEGTRTPKDRPKKNDYLEKFNRDYVIFNLRSILIVRQDYRESIVTDSVASNLADLKLAIQDANNSTETKTTEEKQRYIENSVRTRNQAVQRQFRQNLFANNSHCCPVCGYSFEEFLIASHIKPYAECDDTYDAINHYNGLLMCPNHDKVFEGAKHMTIDATTGEIYLSKAAAESKDYSFLAGKRINTVYIDNERRHYLKWHNDRFKDINS